MTPTEQDKELREKLLDYFASGAPSYKIANQSIKANARIEVDALMPLIDQYVERVALEARLDEAKLVAQLFVGLPTKTMKRADLKDYLVYRIAELKAKHNEMEK